MAGDTLKGPRYILGVGEDGYPDALRHVYEPPERLFVIGDPAALQEGLAVVGARKATPYGLGCAERFAGIAARRGIAIISGGARGCDSKAHEAALIAGAPTVVFMGGGCDWIYPRENAGLFQRIIDAGGALASEHPWNQEPRAFMFRARNRLIAGLAKATLIVEAGLPSGTFSTADYALDCNREVLAIPGAITSKNSMGANRLIYQGAIPIIDDASFTANLESIYFTSGSTEGDEAEEEAIIESDGSYAIADDGVRHPVKRRRFSRGAKLDKPRRRTADGIAKSQISLFPDDKIFLPVLEAIEAKPLTLDEMLNVAASEGIDVTLTGLMTWLARMRSAARVAKYPDGTYGPLIN